VLSAQLNFMKSTPSLSTSYDFLRHCTLLQCPSPFFTARRNARIASAVLATAIHLSVCLSVRPSVTRRYCVKRTRNLLQSFII